MAGQNDPVAHMQRNNQVLTPSPLPPPCDFQGTQFLNIEFFAICGYLSRGLPLTAEGSMFYAIFALEPSFVKPA